MQYILTAQTQYTTEDTRELLEDIKSKDFGRLYLNIVLQEYEMLSLIVNIIKDDTQIDLDDYNLLIEQIGNSPNYKVKLEEDTDLTDSEKKYITKTLTKRYGAEVMATIVGPVIKQKLNRTSYYINENSSEMVLLMPVDVFREKSEEICKYLHIVE